jgi:CRP/FNR family transcriptional regulator, cyclic AMP receptor protein
MTIIQLFRNATDFEMIKAGETIFSQGDEGNEMFVIIEGEVDIIFNGTRIETITEGAALGEIALIDSRPRTATAVAKTDCKLARLDEKRFTFLVQQHPTFALQVMKILVERLRLMREQGIEQEYV